MKTKLLKTVLIAVCAVSMVFANTFAASVTEKNETVYVILDHNGNVIDQRVVNHLHTAGEARETVDYGQYSSVKNMESGWSPFVSNGQITWEPGAAEGKDIYYEGVTDKELPIGIKIKYFLDGREMHAAEFAGKDGTLRVEISLTNKTGTVMPVAYESWEHGIVTRSETLYVPFLVQVSCEASLERFSKINAPGAIRVVVGKTMNLGFSAFPYPDADIAFELTGTNIELEPITFTVVPCMPPMPDMEIRGDMEKLLKGIEEMNAGFIQLQQGGSGFIEGVSSLADGMGELDKNSGTLIAGFDSGLKGYETLKDSLEELSVLLDRVATEAGAFEGSLREVSGSLGNLKEGAAVLAEAGGNIADGIAELQSINGSMAAQAQALIENHPEGSELHTLGMTILAQGEAMKSLTAAGTEISRGGAELSQAIGALDEGIGTKAVPGLEMLCAALTGMNQGMTAILDGMEEYKKGQDEYNKGLMKYMNGVREAAAGLKALNRELPLMLDGVKTIGGEGLVQMRTAIIQAVDNMRLGEGVKKKMEGLATGYRSFMDNSRNRNSSVQFIIKTEKVESPEIDETPDAPLQTTKRNIWQRLLDLFRF
jgi:putative membrane protein